jgi:hypothetical protein
MGFQMLFQSTWLGSDSWVSGAAWTSADPAFFRVDAMVVIGYSFLKDTRFTGHYLPGYILLYIAILQYINAKKISALA